MEKSPESSMPEEPITSAPELGAKDQEAETETPRKAAEITLARVHDYKELWAETEQEGDKKFVEKTRELWKEFAVHGVMGMDKRTKEKTILNFTDLDGKCSIALLKMAGINTNDIKYVAPSSSIEGRINLDTGDKQGLVVEDGGKTAFLDHHADESGDLSSATKITYEVLTSLGLLKKEKYLDNMVEFITQVDNSSFPNKAEHFVDSAKTILGLQRFIDPKHLLDFFKAGKSPVEILTDNDLRAMALTIRSKEQQGIVDASDVRLREMRRDGQVVNSDRYGEIVVDIGKTIPAGFDAVTASGCGAYIIWNPRENNFFISTAEPLTDKFSQGRKVREKMWIKPLHDKTPLTTKLTEILNKMTDGKLQPRDGLKKFLDTESK